MNTLNKLQSKIFRTTISKFLFETQNDTTSSKFYRFHLSNKKKKTWLKLSPSLFGIVSLQDVHKTEGD